MRRNTRKKKKRKRDQDQEVLVVVPEDILQFYILPRLPVKSLLRFKCVCTKWHQWISRDPAFMREQSRFSTASSGITYTSPDGLGFLSTGGIPLHVPDPSLNFRTKTKPKILASCNGLLCISLRKSIYVCNPVTGERSLIPDTKQRDLFGLAFDPLESLLASYKLVCPYSTTSGLALSDRPEEFGFAVFSSSTGVWTISGKKVITPKLFSNLCGSIFAHGILYWELTSYFLWFDPQKDLAGVHMPPPGCGMVPWKDHALGVWEDRLTYTGIHGVLDVEAWIMINFKWKSICKVSLLSAIYGSETNVVIHETFAGTKLVLPFQGGDYLYFEVVSHTRNFVVGCYNIKTGELTKSHECGKGLFGWPVFPYNNSIIRVPKLPKRVSLG